MKLGPALIAIALAVSCSPAEESRREHDAPVSSREVRVVDGAIVVGHDRPCRFRTQSSPGGVEAVVPHAEGVEQQWQFTTRPTAPLEVVVAFDGELRDNDPERATFTCPDGGLAAYGAAELVDARGARTAIARQIVGHSIVLRVPDDVVARAAYPVVLDPVVSAEVRVEGPVPAAQQIAFYGRDAVVVAGPDRWLTVWRSRFGDLYLDQMREDGSHAPRFDVPLLSGYSGPFAASNGSNLLLVVQTSDGVAGYRFSSDGAPLDTTPIPLLPYPAGLGGAAWDGSAHVVLSTSNGKGARLTAAGAVSDTFTLPALSGLSAFDAWVTIVCRPTGDCLALGFRNGETIAARVKDGAVVDGTPIVLHGTSRIGQRPSVAWSGTAWVAVIHDVDGSLVAKSMTADGVLSTTTTHLPVTSGMPAQIACASDGCRVGFADTSSQLSCARLDPSGALLEAATPFAPSFLATEAQVGCTVSRCLVSGINASVIGGFRTAGAAVLDTAAVSLAWGPNTQLSPAVAGGGGTALVAWVDARGDLGGNTPPPRALYAIRSTGAAPLDAPARALGVGGGASLHGIGYDGSDWLAFYSRPADTKRVLYVQRYSSSLAPLAVYSMEFTGSEPIVTSCNATTCLVASLESPDGRARRIYGRLIPKGAAPGTPFLIASPPSLDVQTIRPMVTVAASADGFLVLYGHHASSSYPLFARRVGNDGKLLDAAPIALPIEGQNVFAASVANVWMIAAPRASPPSVAVLRMSDKGAFLDASPISFGTTGPGGIVDTGDGHSALVRWGTKGTLVTFDGRVLDPSGFDIGDASGPIAAFAPGKLLLAYGKSTHSMPGEGDFVVTRLIETGALDGAACTVGDSCASRYCVDGACCDTTCAGSCSDCSTGKCLAVASAEDPDTCTGTKTCSASGTCLTKPGVACAAATDCASGFCVDGVCCATACGTCGACNVTPGTCTPRAAGASLCGGYVCAGASVACPTTCSDDAGCSADHYCAADKTCQPRKSIAGACAPTDCAAAGCRVCASGFCVDGVCCDSGCDGGCETCATGVCAPRVKGTESSCAPYLCDGSSRTCPTACAVASDCTTGHWCDGGKCAPKTDLGATCATSDACVSGHCVDGVCCDSACSGQCEACDATGRCSAVAGAPHGSRPACATDDDAVCGARACDGVARASCEGRVGSETVCASARCIDGREYDEARCAAGACPTSDGRACPFGCGADGKCESAPGPSPPDSSGGCGCRVGVPPEPPRTSWLLLGLVAWRMRRCRRSRIRCAP